MLTESINSTVEDTIADVIKIGYTSAKEGIKTPIFHLIEEKFIDVVQKGRLDTLLVCNVDKLADSDRFMDSIG